MKKLIFANWKMQLSLAEGTSLAKGLVRVIKKSKSEIILCPDYLSLAPVGVIIKNTQMFLGAQDSAMASQGAYTGEVSPANLKKMGVKYVILGHSERREHLHENSAIINQKIKSALENKLVPVLCIGEKLDEKLAGQTDEYLSFELSRALQGLKIKDSKSIIIAYEPVWAISTNKNAKPLDAESADRIQAFIKKQVKKILKIEVRVIYGGSVNIQNAVEFIGQKNIDGLLIGGASLKLKDFSTICQL